MSLLVPHAKPTIDECIARLKSFLQEHDGEWLRYHKVILATLEAHKRITEAAEVTEPVSFRRFHGALKPVDRGAWVNGPCDFYAASEVDAVIADLLAAYDRVAAERDRHMGAVQAYIDDAEAMKRRAETAERQLADSEEENKRLLQANRDCMDHFNELLRDYKQQTKQFAELRRKHDRLVPVRILGR